MTKIINLDLRELIPFKRHSKIFKNWNALKEGDVLRIINDHEPKPLYYMFQAEHKGKFEWEYEKQGLKDWIFTIKRISPTELGLIEQEIINEGVTRKEMRKLCAVHLEIMKDNLEKQEMNLKQGHPIHTLMEEHKEILDFVDKLKGVVKKLESADNFNDVKMEIEMLRFAAKHLVEADKHHKREEKVLSPELEKRGIIEPSEIMKEEHEELIPKKKELYNLAENYDSFKYLEFL